VRTDHGFRAIGHAPDSRDLGHAAVGLRRRHSAARCATYWRQRQLVPRQRGAHVLWTPGDAAAARGHVDLGSRVPCCRDGPGCP
jgi:hypothetical protein